MGNLLRKYCCPIDVETRTFVPCRTNAGPMSPISRMHFDELHKILAPVLDVADNFSARVVLPPPPPPLDLHENDLIYLTEYEAGCIEADRAFENDLEIYESGIIVNV